LTSFTLSERGVGGWGREEKEEKGGGDLSKCDIKIAISQMYTTSAQASLFFTPTFVVLRCFRCISHNKRGYRREGTWAGTGVRHTGARDRFHVEHLKGGGYGRRRSALFCGVFCGIKPCEGRPRKHPGKPPAKNTTLLEVVKKRARDLDTEGRFGHQAV